MGFCCKCCCIFILATAIFIAASMGLFAAFFPYPSHASCQVIWTFGHSCSEVKNRLIEQMKEWSDNDCSTKQMCNYEYLGAEGSTIRGLHTTPVLKFVDKFNFTLTSGYDGNCYVEAASESLAPYAVIDFGTNYCNIRNLVAGAQLNNILDDNNFKENSTNAVCTMYSIAHCNIY